MSHCNISAGIVKTFGHSLIFLGMTCDVSNATHPRLNVSMHSACSGTSSSWMLGLTRSASNLRVSGEMNNCQTRESVNGAYQFVRDIR